TSAAVVVAATLPVTAVFWLFAVDLVGVLSDTPEIVRLGADYLRIVSLGIPFAALNLVGSRTLVGGDDAYTAMQLRASGAAINVVANAVLIFGLDLGVAGAAIGTVLSNAVVTSGFALGLARGRLPLVGEFPVRVDPFGPVIDLDTARDVVSIGLPVAGRNLVWTVAEFPMLAILATFGPTVVAAFVVARRIWGLMNTPGWGFGLASSSLVGQALAEQVGVVLGLEAVDLLAEDDYVRIALGRGVAG
ncbi:MATE family efflux transporter, partial [Halobium palmae]